MLTDIRLLSGVPLYKGTNHTFSFENQGTQRARFSSIYFPTVEVDDVVENYDDNFIVVDKIINSIEVSNNYNYLRFIKRGKLYFCFIDKIENYNQTEVIIYFTVDVLQTYYFDYDLKDCFVERYTVENDDIFKNLVDENLSFNDYYSKEYLRNELSDSVIVLSSTYSPLVESDVKRLYGDKIFKATAEICYFTDTNSQINDLRDDIDTIVKNGKKDSILSIRQVPKFLLPKGSDGLTISHRTDFSLIGKIPVNEKKIEARFQKHFPRTPKNLKMYSYPFNFLQIDNNQGVSEIFRWEFGNSIGLIDFNLTGSIASEPCEVALYPINYRSGNAPKKTELITMGNFPRVGYVIDSYLDWVAVNGKMNTLNTTFGALNTVVNSASSIALAPATGGVSLLGLASSGGGVAGVISSMNEKTNAGKLADRGNSGTGNINAILGTNNFTFTHFYLTDEDFYRIDDYFTMFGYKMNKVLTPKINHRKEFVYIKNIETNIKIRPNGGMTSETVQEIKSIFNNGIYFWKSYLNIYNFSLDNKIL